MADLVVDGVTFRRNLFGEWCQVSDENGELYIAWQESSCLDEVERLRAAANRTLNAFFCCEGLDNTHLMDAFSEWAVLMGHAAVPEAKAWIAKWEARREQ